MILPTSKAIDCLVWKLMLLKLNLNDVKSANCFVAASYYLLFIFNNFHRSALQEPDNVNQFKANFHGSAAALLTDGEIEKLCMFSN